MNPMLDEEQLADTMLHDDDESEAEADIEAGGPPIVLPSRPAPAPAMTTPHGRTRVLPRLLAMADTYYQGGSLRQAIELYFELVHDHAGSPQARQAEERLLAVARTYEQAGELRQARGIYEQLL